MSASSTSSIATPFTKSWIQALTLAADNPHARSIKPKLEWIDQLSLNRSDTDRLEIAKQLWTFGASEGLTELLWLLPVMQTHWTFDADDIFLFQRRTDDAGETDSPKGIDSFEQWTQALGVAPAEFALVAEVTSTDWAGLVRKEAVRLQHSLDMTAVRQSSILQLPCTARWDLKAWQIQFDQVEWIMVDYEDSPVVPRPSLADIETPVFSTIQLANQSILAKSAVACARENEKQPWFDTVSSLSGLHASFRSRAADFSPWMTRVWNCVWPIVYREQNMLAGQADIEHIRGELKACLAAQPRLTLWMFVFAKLVCKLRFGRGLGFCADFRD